MAVTNLTCVIRDGEYHVAQFGSKQGVYFQRGVRILNFLRDEFDYKAFSKGLDRITLTRSNANAFPNTSGQQLLLAIQEMGDTTDSGTLTLKNSLGTIANRGLIDFAYVIDLDNEMFETYTGMTQSFPEKDERFAGYKDIAATEDNPSKPVAHLKSFHLGSLPTPSLYKTMIKTQITLLKKSPLSLQEATSKTAIAEWINSADIVWF